jgi:hypothetical protein
MAAFGGAVDAAEEAPRLLTSYASAHGPDANITSLLTYEPPTAAGPLLVSTAFQSTVVDIRDALTGEAVHVLRDEGEGPGGVIACVGVVTLEGGRCCLVTGASSGSQQRQADVPITIWDGVSYEQLHVLRGVHSTSIRDLLSYDDPASGRPRLISADNEGALAFWAPATGALLAVAPAPLDNRFCCFLRTYVQAQPPDKPPRQRVAAACMSRRVTVRDAASAGEVSVLGEGGPTAAFGGAKALACFPCPTDPARIYVLAVFAPGTDA